MFYPESQFGGFTDIDGTIAFYLRVNALVEPESVVLDFGCGRGAFFDVSKGIKKELRVIKNRCAKVIGLDVDSVAADNPIIDEFHQVRNGSWPLEDNAIDICVCDNVLEHLENPQQFFSECRRVMKNNGYLCIRTPNRWSYVAIASKLIPNRIHAKVLNIIQEQRHEMDVFPTLYRCNTLKKLRKEISRFGFVGVVYGYEAEPSYLSFSSLAYQLGIFHQKLAPKIIKPTIFAFAQLHKQDESKN